MAEVIEFIGPPGVGKSSVYSGIVKRWKRKYNWAPRHHFLPVSMKADTGEINFWELQVRKLLGKPAFNSYKISRSAYEFLSENPKFVSLCWDLIDNNRREDHLGVDNRFRSAHYLFSVFGYYQAIKHSNDPRNCVSDELLVHRIIQITKDSLNNDELSLFADSVPLPRALMHFDAPAWLLAERINNRKRQVLRHKDLEADRLTELCLQDKARFIHIANLLEKRGVAILTIDTQNNTMEECVNKVLDFLKNIPAS